MDELPKLPGLNFEDHYKSHYGIPKSFEIINGYVIPVPIKSQVGGDIPSHKTIAAIENSNDGLLYDPTLTYGRVKKPNIRPFRPKFVIYDRMALTFKGFFKECLPESPDHIPYRIRNVKIIYFLEDDTIKVLEPNILNSGLSYGLLIRRSTVAKNENGEIYTWKDFNLGTDLRINGILFHIVDCDPFTKEFLISQGIELNDPEISPVDPSAASKSNMMNRLNARTNRKSKTTTISDDKLWRFLKYRGKILRFDCYLDEGNDITNSDCKFYQLFYYLEDYTVAIKQKQKNTETAAASDQNLMLLRRTKLPKDWQKKPLNFPSIYMEITDKDMNEYYQPNDFRIGEKILAFGKRFLLLDCDKFTRDYYENVYKIKQGDRIEIKFPEKPQPMRKLPDYLGIGTPEDSLGSCYGLQPKPPKKDIIKYIKYANKYLRYGCILDSGHVEDKNRKFILRYSLADDTISIIEPPIRNSGIIGGKFLNAQRVMLPDCNRNDPNYYEPKHFYIGAILKINNHHFKITNADYFVYKYMKEHQELYSLDAIKGVQQSLLCETNLPDEIRNSLLQEIQREKTSSEDKDIPKCDYYNTTNKYDKYPESTVVHHDGDDNDDDDQIINISDMEKCLQDINSIRPNDYDTYSTNCNKIENRRNSQIFSNNITSIRNDHGNMNNDDDDHKNVNNMNSSLLKCRCNVLPKLSNISDMEEGYQIPKSSI